MKILFVHTLYGQSGGEDQVFENECNLLSPFVQIKQLKFNNGGSKLAVLCKFLMAPFNLSALYKFNQAVKKEKPDVIHFHNFYFAASPLLIIAAKRKGIPVVVTLHNYRLLCPSATLYHKGKLFLDSLKGGFPWSAVRNKVYRNSFLQTFWLAVTINIHKWIHTWSKVDRYIALTPFAKTLFLKSDLKLDNNQIEVKPNFTVDRGYCIHNRQNYFLFVGRLSPEKGLNILLDSFKGTSFKLLIVGEGPLQAMVDHAVSQNPNIKYLGQRTNLEIIGLMKQATALVFPSMWYEGMPMTILESLSTATPVIAGKIGAMENLIQDGFNGLSVDNLSPESLKEALYKWQNISPHDKTSFARNARDTYERYYTPESNLKQALVIYNSLMLNDKPMETDKSLSEINVLKYPVFNASLEDIQLEQKAVINTLNQYSYVMATKDKNFKEALLASDVLLPDGISIVLACRLLNGSKIKKIAGTDVHQFLLSKLNSTGGGCFYLGSSDTTLEKIKANIKRDYSGIKVGSYSPPYKKEFNDDDNKCMIEAINSFKPDVLFIGMTAPKQEKWAHHHRDALNVKTICSIGAVFDFYAETTARPSQFWVDMGMEWLVRFVHEPRRLWRRYFYYGPVFLYILCKEKFKRTPINHHYPEIKLR